MTDKTPVTSPASTPVPQPNWSHPLRPEGDGGSHQQDRQAAPGGDLMDAAVSADLARFCAKTKLDPETGCINWTGATNDEDYGVFKVNGRAVRAHRWIYEAANGPLDPKLVVRHRCNNPRCVNPDHLLSGTQRDNMKDRDEAGRTPRKLSDWAVMAIHGLPMIGYSVRAIAAMFGVSERAICLILTGDRQPEAISREADRTALQDATQAP